MTILSILPTINDYEPDGLPAELIKVIFLTNFTLKNRLYTLAKKLLDFLSIGI